MFKEIRKITQKKLTASRCIRSKDEDNPFETDTIINKWSEYVELFINSNQIIIHFPQGPVFLKLEIE